MYALVANNRILAEDGGIEATLFNLLVGDPSLLHCKEQNFRRRIKAVSRSQIESSAELLQARDVVPEICVIYQRNYFQILLPQPSKEVFKPEYVSVRDVLGPSVSVILPA